MSETLTLKLDTSGLLSKGSFTRSFELHHTEWKIHLSRTNDDYFGVLLEPKLGRTLDDRWTFQIMLHADSKGSKSTSKRALKIKPIVHEINSASTLDFAREDWGTKKFVTKFVLKMQGVRLRLSVTGAPDTDIIEDFLPSFSNVITAPILKQASTSMGIVSGTGHGEITDNKSNVVNEEPKESMTGASPTNASSRVPNDLKQGKTKGIAQEASSDEVIRLRKEAGSLVEVSVTDAILHFKNPARACPPMIQVMFNKPEYSDLVIINDDTDDKVYVHRFVVEEASQLIKELHSTSGFGRDEEGRFKVICDGDEYNMVVKLCSYLYSVPKNVTTGLILFDVFRKYSIEDHKLIHLLKNQISTSLRRHVLEFLDENGDTEAFFLELLKYCRGMNKSKEKDKENSIEDVVSSSSSDSSFNGVEFPYVESNNDGDEHHDFNAIKSDDMDRLGNLIHQLFGICVIDSKY